MSYKSRGSKVWATAFLLPEHTHLIREYWKETEKIEKPILDSQQIEEINNTVAIAIEEYTLVKVSVFFNGRIDEFVGYINKVDVAAKRIVMTETDESGRSVKFEDVVGVEFV